MGLPIDPPESLHDENGITNRISDTPSLGELNCRLNLWPPFIRQGRGVWHTPHKYPQIEMNNERISGRPSLGKRDCRSILWNPVVRQGRGVWHTPHKYPQIEMNNE